MILRAFIDETDDRDLRSGATHLVNSHKETSLGISHVTVGEALAGIASEKGQECTSASADELHRKLKSGTLSICGIKDAKAYHELAIELHETDHFLEPTDGLILANAILASDCHTFYTTDTKILYSNTLPAFAKSRGTAIKPLQLGFEWRKAKKN